jgi:hypothetical protein
MLHFAAFKSRNFFVTFLQLSLGSVVTTHVRTYKNMKKDANHLKQNQEELNEQQLNELENDTVWSLLDNAEKESPTEASPMFARNLMREIRVNHSPESALSFWQRLTAPRFNKIALTLGATVACAVLIVTQMFEQNTQTGQNTASTKISNELETITFEDIISIEETEEDSFTEEMLELADQDPFYITEEEIEIAMQM